MATTLHSFMDIFDEDGDDRSFNGGTYTRENMIIV